MTAKNPHRTRRNSGRARKGKEIRPGTTVGRRAAADDDVPQIELRRHLVIHGAKRGRHLPSGNPRGLSGKRRSTGSRPGA